MPRCQAGSTAQTRTPRVVLHLVGQGERLGQTAAAHEQVHKVTRQGSGEVEQSTSNDAVNEVTELGLGLCGADARQRASQPAGGGEFLLGALGRRGDAAEQGQQRHHHARRPVAVKHLVEQVSGGVPVVQTQQVGDGGAAGAQHQPAQLLGLLLDAVAEHGFPEGGQLGVDRGLEFGVDAGPAGLDDSWMQPVCGRLVRAGLDLDQPVRHQRAERSLPAARVAGTTQPLPQVRPVALHDRAEPVVLLHRAQELEQQNGRLGQQPTVARVQSSSTRR